jgi:hypothetical protein
LPSSPYCMPITTSTTEVSMYLFYFIVEIYATTLLA